MSLLPNRPELENILRTTWPLRLVINLQFGDKIIMCLDVKSDPPNLKKSAACAMHAASFFRKSLHTHAIYPHIFHPNINPAVIVSTPFMSNPHVHEYILLCIENKIRCYDWFLCGEIKISF